MRSSEIISNVFMLGCSREPQFSFFESLQLQFSYQNLLGDLLKENLDFRDNEVVPEKEQFDTRKSGLFSF